MSSASLEEMGPVDYVLIEWPGRQPNGEVAPHLVDLVDRGLVRILDLAFLVKGEDGSVGMVEIGELGGEVAEYAVFAGAASGVLHEDDFAQAGEVMQAGTSAVLLVYENRWAAPLASAVRRSGGDLVASGRIPVQDLLGALDAAESNA